jgi:hypothetical protein
VRFAKSAFPRKMYANLFTNFQACPFQYTTKTPQTHWSSGQFWHWTGVQSFRHPSSGRHSRPVQSLVPHRPTPGHRCPDGSWCLRSRRRRGYPARGRRWRRGGGPTRTRTGAGACYYAASLSMQNHPSNAPWVTDLPHPPQYIAVFASVAIISLGPPSETVCFSGASPGHLRCPSLTTRSIGC